MSFTSIYIWDLVFKALSQISFKSGVAITRKWASRIILKIGYRSFLEYFGIKIEVRAIVEKLEKLREIEDFERKKVSKVEIGSSRLKNKPKRSSVFFKLLGSLKIVFDTFE